MSLYQFLAAVNGYAEAHTPKEKRGLDDAEVAELSELIDGHD